MVNSNDAEDLRCDCQQSHSSQTTMLCRRRTWEEEGTLDDIGGARGGGGVAVGCGGVHRGSGGGATGSACTYARNTGCYCGYTFSYNCNSSSTASSNRFTRSNFLPPDASAALYVQRTSAKLIEFDSTCLTGQSLRRLKSVEKLDSHAYNLTTANLDMPFDLCIFRIYYLS